MSLLLLLTGAQVQSQDRTFDATWEQVAATWSATMIGPGVAPADFPSRPIERLRPFSQFYARFEQPPASWYATVDVNDDDITLQELGVL